MSDGRRYALKTFKCPSSKQAHDQSEFLWLTAIRCEFEIVTDISHPNVIKLHAFLASWDPAIMMDYYASGNIKSFEPLDEVTRVSAFGQVLSGLRHLHSKGIAHRDLKPENLLVEWKPFFRVAISDFGLSKLVPDSSLLKTFCGSMPYLAPEVTIPNAGYDHVVDIWSLGVIMFEWTYDEQRHNQAISGADSALDWVQKRWSYFRNKLDEEEDGDELVAMLDGMLDKTPSKRWRAAYCLDRGLRGTLFRTRRADGLVVCMHDTRDDPTEMEGSEAPNITSSPDLYGQDPRIPPVKKESSEVSTVKSSIQAYEYAKQDTPAEMEGAEAPTVIISEEALEPTKALATDFRLTMGKKLRSLPALSTPRWAKDTLSPFLSAQMKHSASIETGL